MDTNFIQAKLNGSVDFGGVTFCEGAHFARAYIGGGAGFSDADFAKEAAFSDVSFDGFADFMNASFGRDCSFSHAKFQKRAYFDLAAFSSFTSFDRAQFEMRADFLGTAFSDGAVFSDAVFAGSVWFAEAQFDGDPSFNNGAFMGKTSFENARFTSQVPEFFKREFYDGTIFTTDKKYWPKTNYHNAANFKILYIRLAQVMAQLHKPDDEHFFRRQEMRCKRMLGNWVDWLFLSLYALVSDYGYSIGRPIAGLALTVMAGAVAFMLPRARHASDWAELFSFVPEMLGASLSSTLAFLGFLRRFHPNFFESGPGWIETVSGTQTMLGVVFLFFLGLGLRNRFRLK